jgi:subtilisin family serine protease
MTSLQQRRKARMPSNRRSILAALLIAPLAAALLGCGSSFSSAAPHTAETFAPGHLVVVYKNNIVPAASAAIAAQAGARSSTDLPLFGISAIQVPGDEDAAIAALLANPNVAAVLHDRLVSAHILALQPAPPTNLPGLGKVPIRLPLAPPQPAAPLSDTLYNSPQGWAVLDAGGFGDNIPGGPALGPWNTSRGAGIRIAVLDSGVDPNHPDIAPNLALNLSEVDTTAVPSPCDDGTPQDQQGHGTFTASLATAAIGGGELIGVAPQATLLNIKVLERLPASTGATLTAQCEAGQASGLLSWVLLGLQDAVAHHANIVSLSLGTLVDTATGDGAGWQTQFNAATYTAAQSGTVIVAALGNDDLDLSETTLIELPAQSRSVLPVVASTNPACAEDLSANATCLPGPITRASYSNHGITGAIAAPGGSYPQGSTTTGVTGFVRGACSSGLSGTSDGLPANGQSFGCFGLGHATYAQAIGTSASAPLVAGAAAILAAAHPNWTSTQIVQALRISASTLPALPEPTLNLPAALALP